MTAVIGMALRVGTDCRRALHRAQRFLRCRRVRARQGARDEPAFARPQGRAQGPGRRRDRRPAGPLPVGDPVRDHAREPVPRLDRRARRGDPARSRGDPGEGVAGHGCPAHRRGRARLCGPHLRPRAVRRAGPQAHRHPAIGGDGAGFGRPAARHLPHLPSPALAPRALVAGHPARGGDVARRGQRRGPLQRRRDPRDPGRQRGAFPARKDSGGAVRARDAFLAARGAPLDGAAGGRRVVASADER